MTQADFLGGSALSFAFISVASLERSLQFYRDVIGLTAGPIAALQNFDVTDDLPRAARVASCYEPGTPVGRVLLVEYAERSELTVRQAGDRTTRGFWNVNFYVEHMAAQVAKLRQLGFEFWSDPETYTVGENAGRATEVVFEGPDSVAVNLVEPLGGPDTFVGRVRQQVAQHGKTQTGFTPVATTAHCVTDVAAAVAFYSQVLGMKVVLDETLGRAETNRFLARPADARTHTVFVAGSHFYGKIALNEPQNFFVPERVALAHAPRVGYLAQGFRVDDLDAAAQRFQQRFPGTPYARIDWPKLPEWPTCEALRVSIPGSGGMAFLLGPACG